MHSWIECWTVVERTLLGAYKRRTTRFRVGRAHLTERCTLWHERPVFSAAAALQRAAGLTQ